MDVLIDGKNLLYKALFTKSTDDKFLIVCRILQKYYNLFKPCNLHVFWDTSKKTVWRRKYYPEYKDGRSDPPEDLDKYQKVCLECFMYMGIRQYYKYEMEADDLIYAFCHKFRGNKITVISSDKDIEQIPYFMDHVQLFEPRKSKVIDRPKINPVEVKCLKGDKSDNINGYFGIGDVKSENLASDNIKLQLLIEDKGDKIYKENRLLIDLSLCPYILDNIMYVSSISIKETKFDLDKIKDLICNKYKIRGVMSKFSELIVPLGWK